MAEEKTLGGWMDVTSEIRNEIVFEGRNKEYGAYFVRRLYNKSVFIAISVSIAVRRFACFGNRRFQLPNGQIEKVRQAMRITIFLFQPMNNFPRFRKLFDLSYRGGQCL